MMWYSTHRVMEPKCEVPRKASVVKWDIYIYTYIYPLVDNQEPTIANDSLRYGE